MNASMTFIEYDMDISPATANYSFADYDLPGSVPGNVPNSSPPS